jgi:hypothetical protein
MDITNIEDKIEDMKEQLQELELDRLLIRQRLKTVGSHIRVLRFRLKEARQIEQQKQEYIEKHQIKLDI